MNIKNNMSMTDLQKTALISGNKAMQMLELSRHSFEKVVKDGLLRKLGDFSHLIGNSCQKLLVHL